MELFSIRIQRTFQLVSTGIVRKENRQYGTEQGREDAMRRL